MIKKILTVCILQTLLASTALCAANINDNSEEKDITTLEKNAIIPIDKCVDLSKQTTNFVKMINKDLFLDNLGYKVMPCSKDDLVHFTIIEKYPDGIKLFNESKNEILNKSNDMYSSNISINFDKNDYNITYGNGTYDVKDVTDFQNENNKEKLGIQTSNNNNENKTINNINDLKTLIKFPEPTPLNDKFKTYIDEEKEKLIISDFKTVTGIFSELAKTELMTYTSNFVNTAVSQNRLFLNTNNIVNQYLPVKNNKHEDTNNEINTDNYINGNLFELYSTKQAKYNFYMAINDKLKDYVCDSTIGLDDKLAMMETLVDSQKDLKTSADTYVSEKENNWNKNSLKMDELNVNGNKLYKESTNANQQQYIALVSQINQQIIEKEVNQLPNKITKSQYKSLSDIDKYKYIPMKEKNYVNKNFYIKLPIEKILELKNIDKK